LGIIERAIFGPLFAGGGFFLGFRGRSGRGLRPPAFPLALTLCGIC
jgi:hypothetical protein